MASTSSSGSAVSSAARRRFSPSCGLPCSSATAAWWRSVSGWTRRSAGERSPRTAASSVSSSSGRPLRAWERRRRRRGAGPRAARRSSPDLQVDGRRAGHALAALDGDERDDLGVVARLDGLVGVGVADRRRRSPFAWRAAFTPSTRYISASPAARCRTARGSPAAPGRVRWISAVPLPCSPMPMPEPASRRRSGRSCRGRWCRTRTMRPASLLLEARRAARRGRRRPGVRTA